MSSYPRCSLCGTFVCRKKTNFDCPTWTKHYFNTIKARKNEQKDIQHDPVNKPKHYNQGKIQPIDFIHDQKLDFNLGNAIKYIARAPYKNNYKEDLEKAIWYLQDAIKRWKGTNNES